MASSSSSTSSSSSSSLSSSSTSDKRSRSTRTAQGLGFSHATTRLLPTDVERKALSWLTMSELGRVSVTCHDLESAVSTLFATQSYHPVLFTDSDEFEEDGDYYRARAFALMRRHALHLERINVRSDLSVHDLRLATALVAMINRCSQTLRVLETMHYEMTPTVLVALSRCPKLEAFSMQALPGSRRSGFVSRDLELCKAILTGCAIRKLTLTRYHHQRTCWTTHQLLQLMTYTPALEDLSITASECDALLQPALGPLAQLHTLRLNVNTVIAANIGEWIDDFGAALAKMSNLKTLDIGIRDWRSSVPNASVRPSRAQMALTSRHLPSLQKLVIRNSFKFMPSVRIPAVTDLELLLDNATAFETKGLAIENMSRLVMRGPITTMSKMWSDMLTARTWRCLEELQLESHAISPETALSLMDKARSLKSVSVVLDLAQASIIPWHFVRHALERLPSVSKLEVAVVGAPAGTVEQSASADATADSKASTAASSAASADATSDAKRTCLVHGSLTELDTRILAADTLCGPNNNNIQLPRLRVVYLTGPLIRGFDSFGPLTDQMPQLDRLFLSDVTMADGAVVAATADNPASHKATTAILHHGFQSKIIVNLRNVVHPERVLPALAARLLLIDIDTWNSLTTDRLPALYAHLLRHIASLGMPHLRKIDMSGLAGELEFLELDALALLLDTAMFPKLSVLLLPDVSTNGQAAIRKACDSWLRGRDFYLSMGPDHPEDIIRSSAGAS